LNQKSKQGLLFLKKKKQKDFFLQLVLETPSPKPTGIKSFLVTFFQKK